MKDNIIEIIDNIVTASVLILFGVLAFSLFLI